MPNLEDNSIQGGVLGDTIKVFRTITKIPAIGDSAGSTATLSIVKAWFTLKPNGNTNDVDDNTALFQKAITTSDVPGVGQIVVAGSGSGDNRTARVRFDLEPADTYSLDPTKEYPWDIQLLFDDGSINTPFKGLLTGIHGVTNKTS